MESLMHYIWQHRLWLASDMRFTVDNRPLTIIDPGRLNKDAGPDFFNAKVRIGDDTWVGNVEIHVRASDWHRHHHDKDPAYDSVILHVVEKDDIPIRRSNGQIIPQVVMTCANDFRQAYNHMISNPATQLSCGPQLSGIDHIYVVDWIEALTYERINEKVDRITDIVDNSAGNWEQACFITIARALGAGVNSESFERVAKSLPLQLLGKHADSLLSLEAFLFGQAGFLDNIDSKDSYPAHLAGEYKFLSNKFSLRKPDIIWKFARMRPQGFPHRRLALLAALCHGGFRLMSQIAEIDNLPQAHDLFNLQLTGFWSNHFNFNSANPSKLPSLSNSSINTVIINAVVPLSIAFHRNQGNFDKADAMLSLLEQLPPEQNSVTRLFEKCGLKATDAFTSQALIQLRRNYCEQHKCLYCRFGHRLLARQAISRQT